jgi:hypothetical protein
MQRERVLCRLGGPFLDSARYLIQGVTVLGRIFVSQFLKATKRKHWRPQSPIICSSQSTDLSSVSTAWSPSLSCRSLCSRFFVSCVFQYPVPPGPDTQGRTDQYISTWLKTQPRDKVRSDLKVVKRSLTISILVRLQAKVRKGG